MKKEIAGVTVEISKGNIAAQPDVTAVVNAANARLMPGGGVAGAIHRAAGPELAEECRSLAPIKPGEAVLTGGYNLPNQHIIHVLGPVYGKDKPENELLAACYRSALQLAEEHRISSVAFPAVSTGAFGYPVEEAGEVAVKTILPTVKSLQHVKLVRLILYSEKHLAIYNKIFTRLLHNAQRGF